MSNGARNVHDDDDDAEAPKTQEKPATHQGPGRRRRCWNLLASLDDSRAQYMSPRSRYGPGETRVESEAMPRGVRGMLPKLKRP